MKLFQQLLVAGAALSFIAPIGAQASDVINLEGMNDYNRSKKSTSKKRFNSNTFINKVNENLATTINSVDSLGDQQNSVDAGVFSSTTTTVSYTHLRAHETLR